MKVVIQRSEKGNVTVKGKTVGQIDQGLVVFVGITHEDTMSDVKYIANKIMHLRIFEDDQNKMNRSLLDVNGSILSISQFTLYGDTRKGRRPNFMNAAKPEKAQNLYEKFNAIFKESGVPVETGEFGEMMKVTLTNSGPVTFVLDSNE
ncbi:D-aminoacyl-tRNA deacylase [Virgibacillus sp. W0181]|uniref:D-aminoacyl-tRNA deacylase n=1 Tax=Virgibacillus sp. W0181 TaxID=3391581 RepID=UPI003F44E76E